MLLPIDVYLKESFALMSFPPLQRAVDAMNEFLAGMEREHAYTNTQWTKLRFVFIDLINKRAVYDLTPKSYELLQKIMSKEDFEKHIGKNMLISLFPALEHKIQLLNLSDEPVKILKIQAPSMPSHDSVRKTIRKSIEISQNLQPRNCKIPERFSRRSKAPSNYTEDTARRSAPDIDRFNHRERTKLTPEQMEALKKKRMKWNLGSHIQNETDALAYVASTVPMQDDIQFHFGKATDNVNRYSMTIHPVIPDEKDFETITKRGIFSARPEGESEFQPIDVFIENKTDYEMVHQLQFFITFRINKLFRKWKNMYCRRSFTRKLDKFKEVCCFSKQVFPENFIICRKNLFSLGSCQIFPVRDDGNVSYAEELNALQEALTNFANNSAQISKMIHESLINFTLKINKEYHDLRTLETASFLSDDKIPSDLYFTHKNPNKKSLGMVEEKAMKVEYKKKLQFYQLEISQIPKYYTCLDKAISTFFLSLIRNQFHVFSNVFVEASHQMKINVILDYVEKDIAFKPSLDEAKDLINNHINGVFDELSKFVRPCRIDPQGSIKPLEFPTGSFTIPEFIQKDQVFSNDLQKIMKTLEKSFKNAEETFKAYQPSAVAISNFISKWPEMKENTSDPTIFITNLSELNDIQSHVEGFKNIYEYDLLRIDCRNLRTFILDFIEKTVEENNKILFTEFENICTNFTHGVYTIMENLMLTNDSLESVAAFAQNLKETKVKIPKYQKDFEIVNSIYNRALTHAPMLIPVIIIQLKNVKTANERFYRLIDSSEQVMRENYQKTKEQLLQKQKMLEERIETLDRQMKTQFGAFESNISAETAINDLNKAIEKIDLLQVDIDEFKVLAAKMVYTEFDFSGVADMKVKLQADLAQWMEYSDFMHSLSVYYDAPVKEVNYRGLIQYLNSHNERELRARKHPLYDKMANAFSQMFQYLPLFKCICKLNFNEQQWEGAFDILKVTESEKTTTLRKFLTPNILNYVDDLNIFIMNQLEKADLSQTFDRYIFNMKNLKFIIFFSKHINAKIISFPEIYDAQNKCEDFLIYLDSLKSSTFFATIEKQVIYWDLKICEIMKILDAIIDFQTQYISLSAVTTSCFGSIHYYEMFRLKKHVDNWFKNFISQIEYDSSILTFTSRIDPENPTLSSRPKKSKILTVKDIVQQNLKQNSIMKQISSKLDEPIIKENSNLFGEYLIKCLKEAEKRSSHILLHMNFMIDQMRIQYPRLFLCDDQSIVRIILASGNVNCIVDDLLPVFPSLSRFQCNGNSIMGCVSTQGEMLQFRNDFVYDGLTPISLLQRTENEIKNSVNASILEAVSAHDFTTPAIWLVRYNSQALLIAESIYFANAINQMFAKPKEKRNWNDINTQSQKLLEDTIQAIENSPSKCQSLAVLAGMKMRHLEILKQIKDDQNFTQESFIWQRFPSHYINVELGTEKIYTKIGNFSFAYENEMVSDPDFGPMTTAEEDALLSIASCMNLPEFSLMKQMNGHRFLVKAFADLCGIPFYQIKEFNNNVLNAVFKLKCVINILDLKSIPSSFPGFYGILENRTPIMKCENHFTKINLDGWKSMISVGTNEIPSWIKYRMRPIYLQNTPPKDFIANLMKIRPKVNIDYGLSCDFVEKAIKLPHAASILQTITDTSDTSTIQFFFWFDVPEFIITNKLIRLKNAVSYTIPTSLNKKIDELTTLFDKYDAFEYSSQAPYFPEIDYNTTIDIINYDIKLLFICIFSALKDKIFVARLELMKIDDSETIIKIHGVRPLTLRLYKMDKLREHANAWISPTLKPIDVLKISLQHNEIVEQYKNLEPLITVFLTNVSENLMDPLSFVLFKISVLRYIINTTKKPILEIAESIFMPNPKIDEKVQIQTAFANYLPIIIVGDNHEWKYKQLKDLVNNNSKQNDFILYSSPYNNKLDVPLCTKLELSTKSVYRPSFDGEIFLCISDIHNASDDVFNTIHSLVSFDFIYSHIYQKYINFSKVHLVFTANDATDLINIGKSFFVIHQPNNIQEMERIEFKAKINSMTTQTLQDYVFYNNLQYKLNDFELCTRNIKGPIEFIALAALFFGLDIIDEIGQNYEITKENVLEYFVNKGANFDWIPYKHFSGMINTIIEVNMSAIVVADQSDNYLFSKIPNVNFIILQKKFRRQLFKEIVNVGETKQKTVFIADMNYIDNNEVFDLLDFLLLQGENPESSAMFDPSDIRIFQHYFIEQNSEELLLQNMKKFINFIFIVKQQNLSKFAPNILERMVVIEPYDVSSIMPEHSFFFDETEILKPYLNIPAELFDEIVHKRVNYFREKYSEVAWAISAIIDFVEIYTNLRPVINNINHGVSINESNEKELFERIDKVQAKIDDLDNRVHKCNDELKAKINQLQLLQAKLHAQVPNDIQTAKAGISAYSVDEQISMITKWIAKSDDFQPYTSVFRDIFGYASFANLIETPISSKHCNLALSVMNFQLEDNESLIYSKLEKYGLDEDSQPDSPIRKLMNTTNELMVSPIPIVNVFLSWLKIIVNYHKWSREMGDISLEIGELQAKRTSTLQQIDELKKEAEDLNERIKMRENKDACPTWLLAAYNQDPSDVFKMLEITEQLMKDISNFGEFLNDSERALRMFPLIMTAFEYGFGSISREERSKVYSQLGFQYVQNPFEMVKRPFDFEIFNPVINYLYLFTSTTCGTVEDSLSDKTSVQFSTSSICDILYCMRIFPRKANLQTETPLPKSSFPAPRQIFYDPLDVASQSLIFTHPKIDAAYTDSFNDCCAKYTKSLSDGSPLIIYLVDRKSCANFFLFMDYIQLQIDCNSRFEYDGKIMSARDETQIYLITKTLDIDLSFVSVINCNVERMQHTIWFDLVSVFSVNQQLQKAFEQLIVTCSAKIREGIGSLKRIVDLIKDSRWNEFFENSQKNLSFKNFADNVATNLKTYNSNLENLFSILGTVGDHPTSLTKYKTFTNLLRALADSSNDLHSPFEAILSPKHLHPDSLNSPISPIFAINKIPEISLTFANLLPCDERIKFLVNYESSKLRSIIDSKNLLFDYNFPKLAEKPAGPMMPQLIQHLSQHYLSMPDGFFSFVSPENIIEPHHFFTKIILDDSIPTDLYARCMSSMMQAHGTSLLTIGSFTDIKSPEELKPIFKLCNDNNATLMVIFDSKVPLFVVHSMIFYAHITKNCNYFIMTAESDMNLLPEIPAAFVIRVSKFNSLSGATRFMKLTPYSLRVSSGSSRSLMYLMLLLAHRKDFPLSIQHIHPLMVSVSDYFTPPFGRNPERRKLWASIVSSLIASFCDSSVIVESFDKIIKHYFEDEKPKLPVSRGTAFDTDAVFQSEIPPTPLETGMVLSFGDKTSKACAVRTVKSMKTYGFSEDGTGMKGILYNARFNNGRISTTGDREVFVKEEKFSAIGELVRIPMIKDNCIIGIAYGKTTMSSDPYYYCPTFIVLS